MNNFTAKNDLSFLCNELEESLMQKYGPVLSGLNLSNALGYKSYNAFRQSLRRGTMLVPLFTIPNRRGKFALSKDVARWLAHQRLTSVVTQHKEVSME